MPTEEAAALCAALEDLRTGPSGPARSVAECLLAASLKEEPPVPSAGRPADTPPVVALAAAAIETLRGGPDAAIWTALHRLRLASPCLRMAMDDRIAEITQGDPDLAEALAAIAFDLSSAAVADPLGRACLWDREQLAALLNGWREAPDLAALWSGFGGWRRLTWIGDDALHDALGALSAAGAVRLAPVLARLQDPHSAASALAWLGTARRFRTWLALLEAAPPAFTDDGAWNGDCLVPLLLAAGHEKLGGRGHWQGPAPGPGEVERLTDAIAACVAARPDAARLGRWFATLVVACVVAPSDGNSGTVVRAAANEALLRALARHLPERTWESPAAASSIPKDDWCLRAANVLAATEGKAAMPSPDGFILAWRLSPDEVHEEQGGELARLAGPFLPMEKWPSGPGAALLGLPFAADRTGAEAWARLWADAASLREVLEFGAPSEAWGSAASRAADLLRLAFAVGFAALSRVEQETHKLGRLPDAERWLRVLFDAAREMRAIDGSGYEDWTLALRLLALQRARLRTTGAAALPAEFEPTLAALLASFGGDAVAVVAAVIDLSGQGLGPTEIVRLFSVARIDVKKAIESTIILAEADARRSFLRDMAVRASALTG